MKRRIWILLISAVCSFCFVIATRAQQPPLNVNPVGIVLIRPDSNGRFSPIGSGVYLGEGIALTNWHIATNAAVLILQGIDFKTEDQLLRYQFGDRKNSQINNWVCLAEPNQNPNAKPEEQIYKISATNTGKCIPYNLTQWQAFRPSPINASPQIPELPLEELLFLDRDLEVAVVKLDPQKFDAIEVSPPCLEREPIKPGEKLTIQSHAYGRYPAVTVSATVKDEKPELRLDPDPRVPANNRYAAMTVIATLPPGKGNLVGPGSSGGPVFNQDGKLVGLVWTGVDLPNGTKEVWITPTSVWLPQLQKAQIPDPDLEKVLDTACPAKI